MLSAAQSRLPTNRLQLLRRARGLHTRSPVVALLEATSVAALVAEVVSLTTLLLPPAPATVLRQLAVVVRRLRRWMARSIPTVSSVRAADIPGAAALLLGESSGFRRDVVSNGSLEGSKHFSHIVSVY